MKRWYSPTLARRILLTAVLAFALCFVVIIAFSFYQMNNFNKVQGVNLDGGRKAYAESLSQVLLQCETDEQVRTVAEGWQRVIEAQSTRYKMPIPLHIQVWTNDGRRIYTSFNLPAQRPPELSSPSASFNWDGKSYNVTSIASPRYKVDVLDSTPIRPRYRTIGWDVLSDILLKMAIAFPFAVFPVWFAVHTGLKPLDVLSETLQRRPVDDLTPIKSNMRYEELQPIVQAINDLLERLRHKIRQEQSFVHDAAHELQTPLAVIANQTHVLASASTTDERTEAHRNAQHAIERAGHLVRQMVVLARLDSDQPDVLTTFDVAAKVRELLSPLVADALTRSIELTLESPDSVLLHGDPGALHSILGNLVDNALRYTGTGTGGEILIEIEPHNDTVILRVIDNGPGIRSEDRERVFDRYYRVAGTGVSGSGLGLSIVKQAVSKMQGTITLSDGMDRKGCTFEVTLPTGHIA